MAYKFNPKTEGSGIICCIPQKGTCPNKCEDCFFQSGRSYLEPLDENLPNVPPVLSTIYRVVRVNDGNDSNVLQDVVLRATWGYQFKFYNTAIPHLEGFDAPVVLTLNPGKMTDESFHRIDPIPKNLMFVRIRTNVWNLKTVVDPAVAFYSEREIPVVLTFMAYYDTPAKMYAHSDDYVFRKRKLNSYWAVTTAAWRRIMQTYEDNKWVHSCGKIEGEKGDSHCRFCGNCLREYFATMERK